MLRLYSDVQLFSEGYPQDGSSHRRMTEWRNTLTRGVSIFARDASGVNRRVLLSAELIKEARTAMTRATASPYTTQVTGIIDRHSVQVTKRDLDTEFIVIAHYKNTDMGRRCLMIVTHIPNERPGDLKYLVRKLFRRNTLSYGGFFRFLCEAQLE